MAKQLAKETVDEAQPAAPMNRAMRRKAAHDRRRDEKSDAGALLPEIIDTLRDALFPEIIDAVRAEITDADDVPAFARKNKISRSQTYVEINAGRLIASKVGSRTIITRENGEAWRRSLPRMEASG